MSMDKDRFLDLGISEELATLCSEEWTKETQGYVSKEDYDKVVSDRDKIESDNNKMEGDFRSEIEKLKIDNAINIGISNARGKNLKSIKALIDYDNINIDEYGDISGVSEQIESLLKNDDTRFLFGNDKVVLKGTTPSSSGRIASISKDDFRKMGYNQRLELLNSNRELYNELSN